MDSMTPKIPAIVAVVDEIMDSSSSSEDDEINFKLLQGLCSNYKQKLYVPRIEKYVEEVVTKFTKDQFKCNFRLYPETFNHILSMIEYDLKRKIVGAPMICPRTQFLLALWRLGTPDSFRSICERFHDAPNFIKWPSGSYIEEIAVGFKNISGFPRIIGAIDGTHIHIPAPKDNPASYVNRKGYHSIQLQAVCDQRCRFIHIYTGQVGSVHDQRVLRQSEIQNYLGDLEKFPNDSHIVGDSAYKLHENLLVPYRDNGHLTQRQKNYNFCHSSARICIERAFGLLKGRFRSLLNLFVMNRTDLIPMHILACCVLHNICIMQNDELHINDVNAADTHENYSLQSNNCNVLQTAITKRDLICVRLQMRDI
ncbi:putative nuclease HARBI1 [Prorops nasuta]|uniref:putative nuclease HARBI1 n=1 Tax=Prorops nasuta TaxID=863751 RepID=UPI0034CEABB9